MLLAAIDKVVEANELDDIDPDGPWDRDPDSRRRKSSLALPTECKDGPSSRGGDDARLFWPAKTPLK